MERKYMSGAAKRKLKSEKTARENEGKRILESFWKTQDNQDEVESKDRKIPEECVSDYEKLKLKIQFKKNEEGEQCIEKLEESSLLSIEAMKKI